MKKYIMIRQIKLHTKPLRILSQVFNSVIIKRETNLYYIMEDGTKIKKDTVTYLEEVK